MNAQTDIQPPVTSQLRCLGKALSAGRCGRLARTSNEPDESWEIILMFSWRLEEWIRDIIEYCKGKKIH